VYSLEVLCCYLIIVLSAFFSTAVTLRYRRIVFLRKFLSTGLRITVTILILSLYIELKASTCLIFLSFGCLRMMFWSSFDSLVRFFLFSCHFVFSLSKPYIQCSAFSSDICRYFRWWPLWNVRYVYFSLRSWVTRDVSIPESPNCGIILLSEIFGLMSSIQFSIVLVRDIWFNVQHSISDSTCCLLLYLAEYCLLTLVFLLLVLFGFQIIRVATCMGGSSTSSIHTTRHTYNLHIKLSCLPLRDSLARQTFIFV
jgi:hypothetical protein